MAFRKSPINPVTSLPKTSNQLTSPSHKDLIDAMTKSPFRGNPTPVFILDHEHQGLDFPVWPDDAVLQAVAGELNQSDAIFVRPITRAEGVGEHVEDVKTAESEGRNDVNGVREYLIRSFTTRKEEKFCGHGIFAAAYALEEGTGDEEGGRVLRFYTVGGIVVDARFVGGEGAEDKGGAFGKVRTLQVELPREAVVERTFRDEDVVKGKIARCLGISDDKILALGRNSLMDLVIEVSEEVDFSAASMEIDGVALMHACPQRTRSQIITGKEGSFGAEFVKRMFAYGSEGEKSFVPSPSPSLVVLE